MSESKDDSMVFKGRRSQGPQPEKLLDISVKVRHTNRLPDPPMEPKRMSLPFLDLSRFQEYKTTALEKNHIFQLTAETDLDLNLDLITTERGYESRYVANPEGPKKVDPEDQFMLGDKHEKVQVSSENKRSEAHNETVSWMRKMQYLGADMTRYGIGKSGFYHRIKAEKPKHLTRDSQIVAIKESFINVCKTSTKHPTKKDVYAVEEFPLFPNPDSQLPFVQVIFDSDPAPSRRCTNKDELMKRALINGFTDDAGESYVAYYAPTDESLKKMMESVNSGLPLNPEERLEFKLGREFNWSIRTAAMRGFELYHFFAFRNGRAYYCDINNRMKLTRRKRGETTPQTMLVKNDELNEEERAKFEMYH